MITIKMISVDDNTPHANDFLRSVSSQASRRDVYEIIYDGQYRDEYIDSINFVNEQSPESRILITLPDTCLVLGKDWDKYIDYNLDNNKPIDEHFVKRRMGLIARPDNGVFIGLEIKYPIATE